MNQQDIIVIINKKPYTLNASDVEKIRNIPSVDRQQLIVLLEAIKREEVSTQQMAAKVSAITSTISSDTSNVSGSQYMQPERQASADPDALMAQLIMEDQRNKKPGLTKHSIQKWTAIIAVVVFLLILFL
ncbi:MAG: hypothetical protein OEY06_05280 [Gammaproteobacteria bacterium]|nr:hypothetical protein [Gammaproteobacteria bacterium]